MILLQLKLISGLLLVLLNEHDENIYKTFIVVLSPVVETRFSKHRLLLLGISRATEVETSSLRPIHTTVTMR